MCPQEHYKTLHMYYVLKVGNQNNIRTLCRWQYKKKNWTKNSLGVLASLANCIIRWTAGLLYKYSHTLVIS